MKRTRLLVFCAVFGALSAGSPSQAEIIYAMTATSSGSTSPGGTLVTFDSATPNAITTIGAFSGIVAGHTVREIDARPLTGQLYAISTDAAFNAQIYTVDASTGALTPQGATFAMTGATSAIASIDFNPQADRLRIVTRGGQSYRWNPNTSAFVAQDTSVLVGATTPDLIGIAYSVNVANANNTTLYAWDYATDSLLTIGGPQGVPSPNSGTAFTVFNPAPAFRTFNAGLDMEISGATGICYVTHDDPATGTLMNLYSIDLVTGAETLIGPYGPGVFISSIAIVPEPTSMAFCGVALAGFGIRTWRKRKAS